MQVKHPHCSNAYTRHQAAVPIRETSKLWPSRVSVVMMRRHCGRANTSQKAKATAAVVVVERRACARRICIDESTARSSPSLIMWADCVVDAAERHWGLVSGLCADRRRRAHHRAVGDGRRHGDRHQRALARSSASSTTAAAARQHCRQTRPLRVDDDEPNACSMHTLSRSLISTSLTTSLASTVERES